MLTEDGGCFLVDTNIWHYAHISPKEPDFIPIHKKARKFLNDLLKNKKVTIAITTYQISEILDLFRKGGMGKKERQEFLEDFFSGGFVLKDLSSSDTKECLSKSINSGIHVYDYLVAIPLKGLINRIYSADDHFQQQDFTNIAEVVNPLSPWILVEGKKPKRSS